MRQQPLHAVFYQVEHTLKVLRATVIRVRHHGVGVLLKKLGQAPDFFQVRGRAHRLGERLVVPVHGEDEVVVLKVMLSQWPGSQRRQVVAAQGSMVLRAAVRGFARVKVVRAGRIDRDALSQARLREPMAHDTFGRGAAANIAHANE